VHRVRPRLAVRAATPVTFTCNAEYDLHRLHRFTRALAAQPIAMRFGTSFARMNAMFRIAIAVLAALLCSPAVHAQVDPVRRDLFEFGYDQPLAGHAPVGAYVFYYLSRPQFGDADHALRIALSPVYVDAEWAVRDAFAPHTDVGIEISGGGIADD
jgi:hypothetical protein